MSATIEIRLPDDQLKTLAKLVADQLREHAETPRAHTDGPLRQKAARGLVDPKALAELLGVSRSTVYEHAEELGAVEIGSGSRPRLRFDPDRALQAWTSRTVSVESQVAESPAVIEVRPRSRAIRSGSGIPLLPIRGVSSPAAAYGGPEDEFDRGGSSRQRRAQPREGGGQ